MKFPKPKDMKKRGTGIEEKKDGRIVLSDDKWRQQRLYLLACGADVCFSCGTPLDAETLRVHHPKGRGIGGGKRDDRPWLSGVHEPTLAYPFMPQPPAGRYWQLYALCDACHKANEHNQGCKGRLQFGRFKRDESSNDSERERSDNLLAESLSVDLSSDIKADREIMVRSQRSLRKGK
jgi:5-methylcytosine-specific restriction endonuclease McrA